MSVFKRILICIVAFLMTGCVAINGIKKVTTSPGSYRYVSKSIYYNHYEVEIISEPPGAMIEWDNDCLGRAPVKKIYSGMRGKSSGSINKTEIVVKATPAGSGYAQVKYLKSNVPLPKTIYFNTNSSPSDAKYDSNIDQTIKR